MPNPNLYLHEIIHIVGAGSEPYKQHTAEGWQGRWRSGGAELVGMWQQSGSTGDWPKVINLWEMKGWDHWAEILERQYSGEGQPPGLREWWARALAWRSGGHDRILEPADFSPTRQELVDGPVRGKACIQEIATCVPGKVDDYLDAVASRWRPVASRRGLTLAGAWRVTMRDDEAVLLWCLPTLRDYTNHLKDVRTAPATRAWAETARTWRTQYRETLLVPSQWCVVHPAWGTTLARKARRAPSRAPAKRPERR
jgi:hypothetical protein